MGCRSLTYSSHLAVPYKHLSQWMTSVALSSKALFQFSVSGLPLPPFCSDSQRLRQQMASTPASFPGSLSLSLMCFHFVLPSQPSSDCFYDFGPEASFSLHFCSCSSTIGSPIPFPVPHIPYSEVKYTLKIEICAYLWPDVLQSTTPIALKQILDKILLDLSPSSLPSLDPQAFCPAAILQPCPPSRTGW